MSDSTDNPHSIRYDASTSEIKDDYQALASCLKSGTGQLTRQEAGFLLWFHVLQGPTSCQDVAASGAISACLTVLDHSETTAAERNCAAGILHNLAQVDEIRDAIARGKSQKGNYCLKAVSDSLKDCSISTLANAVGALRQLSENAAARSAMLKSVQQRADWPAYVKIIGSFTSGTKARAETASFCRFLFTGRDDLKAEAGEAGLAAALVKMMQEVKNEAAMQAATGCLWRLLGEESNCRRAAEAGAMRVLVDIIGPPPPRIVELAQMPTPRTLAQAKSAAKPLVSQRSSRLAKQTSLASSLPRGADLGSRAPTAETISRGDLRSAATRTSTAELRISPDLQPSSSGAWDADSLSRTQRSNISTGRDNVTGARLGSGKHTLLRGDSEWTDFTDDEEEHAAGEGLESGGEEEWTLTEELPLDKCSAGIGWGARLGVETRANAAGCLAWLAVREVYCMAISQRAGVHRLVPFLQQIMMTLGDAGKRGKAKKKSQLVLDPLTEQALVNVTGSLRLLTNIDTNKVRVLKLGALPTLITLCEDAARTKIRMSARQIISNLAMLAENGKELAMQGVPEQFLCAAPYHLDKDDIEELKLEFTTGSSVAEKSAWQVLQQRRHRLAHVFDKQRQAVEDGLDLVYKIARSLRAEPSLAASAADNTSLGRTLTEALPPVPGYSGAVEKSAVAPNPA